MDDLKNVSDENQGSKNIGSNSYNYVNIGILVALSLKCIGLYPLIIKVAEKKTAEEISFATPVFFFTAFSILFAISIIKKFYIPSSLFFIGMFGSAILFVQKLIYHLSDETTSSKNNEKYYDEAKNYNNEINNYNKFSKTNMPNE